NDEIALALAYPAPKRRGIACQPHLEARARKRLIENGTDGCVVVGYKNATCGHRYSSSSVLWGMRARAPFPTSYSLQRPAFTESHGASKLVHSGAAFSIRSP